MDNEYKKARTELAEKRKAKVRALRSAGWTWAKIGEQLGITRARAHQLGKPRNGG